MDDLIKRQDAIDCFWDEERHFRDALDAVKDIRHLPSAQQWIPVNERLPEIGVFALVTLQHFNGEIDVVIAKVVKGYFSKGLEWESDDGEWTWGIKHGIAWMPLPEAWKGSEDKK